MNKGNSSKVTDADTMGLRELSRAIERSPSQIKREMKRNPHGFPVKICNGKPRFVLADVVRYRLTYINTRKPTLRSIPATKSIAQPSTIPGDTIHLLHWLTFRVTLADVKSRDHLFSAVKWLGAKLYAEQSSDDLRALVNHLNYAIADAMNNIVASTGGELEMNASQDYYNDLFLRIDAATLSHGLEAATWCWAARRFARTDGWWKQLASPLQSCPFAADAVPLAHRH